MSDRTWLDVPFAEKDAAKAAGARWDPEAKRWWAPPGREQNLAQWQPLPPLADPLPGEDRNFGTGLFVDLVPSSCWFTNVRSCVSPGDWDRLRRLVYGRADNRCEACGSLADPSQALYLEAHERWSYDDVTHVQALRRLICLCSACHLSTHMGFANVRGRTEEATAHLMAVNNWTRTVADEHISAAFDLWAIRSRADWTLDLGMLSTVGVTVQRPPERGQRRGIAKDTLGQQDQ